MNKFTPDAFESKDLPFKVNRLSPTIGGEILGVDLSRPLTKELKDLIYEALLVYKVIFFLEIKNLQPKNIYIFQIILVILKCIPLRLIKKTFLKF